MVELIGVQVSYATPLTQCLRVVRVPNGATVRQVLELSGVLHEFPEIDLQQNPVGIYGRLKELQTVVREHDRIEIYRPLTADPGEARRRRVAKSGAPRK